MPDCERTGRLIQGACEDVHGEAAADSPLCERGVELQGFLGVLGLVGPLAGLLPAWLAGWPVPSGSNWVMCPSWDASVPRPSWEQAIDKSSHQRRALQTTWGGAHVGVVLLQVQVRPRVVGREPADRPPGQRGSHRRRRWAKESESITQQKKNKRARPQASKPPVCSAVGWPAA